MLSTTKGRDDKADAGRSVAGFDGGALVSRKRSPLGGLVGGSAAQQERHSTGDIFHEYDVGYNIIVRTYKTL